MTGCWALTAAILKRKFPGSVKLTCPENQCHIMRRLENWKHKDLGNQGYTYSLESNQSQPSSYNQDTFRLTEMSKSLQIRLGLFSRQPSTRRDVPRARPVLQPPARNHRRAAAPGSSYHSLWLPPHCVERCEMALGHKPKDSSIANSGV